MKKFKFKRMNKLDPIMAFIILIGFTIVLSGFLSLVGFETTYNKINPSTGEYASTFVNVESLFSLSGLKYIFSSTVSNFVAFTPLSMLIIVLIGIGIMEKSGFLKTAFTLITKSCKKNTLTFILVFVCVLSSIGGDLGYVIMIPLSALLFYYGKRNPIIGLITAFAGLTAGSGISIFLTSVDSTLLSSTILSAKVLDPNYSLNTFAFFFIMIVATLLVSFLITIITEKILTQKVGKYEFKDNKEVKINRRELKGLIFGLGAGIIYLIIFAFNIIPGLPLSGKLLDYSQTFYIDKLFSYNSFFSNGFVFIITMLFVILGLFYGIGAKTIKNNHDVCDCLGHSLDGIGKTLVLILFASILINIFKKSNIGTVVLAMFANLITNSQFTGVPLIILLFIIGAIGTLFVPSSITKWSILSGTIVPVAMNAGISGEFAQIIFRFSECATIGLTPLLAYFVIYLAFVEKYKGDEEHTTITESIKYQLPYGLSVGAILIVLLIVWYVIGLPIGFGGVATL